MKCVQTYMIQAQNNRVIVTAHNHKVGYCHSLALASPHTQLKSLVRHINDQNHNHPPQTQKLHEIKILEQQYLEKKSFDTVPKPQN